MKTQKKKGEMDREKQKDEKEKMPENEDNLGPVKAKKN